MIIKANDSIYAHEDEYITPCGSRVIDSYVLDFPDAGGVALKKCGEKNIYEMIQANLVNCDLQSVIEACGHSNQYSTTTHDGLDTLIADFTGATNLGDLYVGAKRMENTWKDLPLEVREEFGSDIKNFIRGIGTADFNESVSRGFDKYNNSLKKVAIQEPSVPPSQPQNTPLNDVPAPGSTINESEVNNEFK